MKLLLFINAEETKQQTGRTQRRLQSLCKSLDATMDTCVYGSSHRLESLCKETLTGRVYTLVCEIPTPDSVTSVVVGLASQKGYDGVILAQGEQAGSMAVLLATKWGASCVTGVSSIHREGAKLSCEKLVYNNNLKASYPLTLPFVISERLPIPADREIPFTSCERIPLPVPPPAAHLLSHHPVQAAREKNHSPVLFAVGMGVGTRDELSKIRGFAEENGFDFGVTRPVAMHGWASLDEIIGVSGGIFSPAITITIGVSGAAAFFVGIEQSDYILSINSNPHATIAVQSDAIIVDDYRNVLGCLLPTLQKYRRTSSLV